MQITIIVFREQRNDIFYVFKNCYQKQFLKSVTKKAQIFHISNLKEGVCNNSTKQDLVISTGNLVP